MYAELQSNIEAYWKNSGEFNKVKLVRSRTLDNTEESLLQIWKGPFHKYCVWTLVHTLLGRNLFPSVCEKNSSLANTQPRIRRRDRKKFQKKLMQNFKNIFTGKKHETYYGGMFYKKIHAQFTWNSIRFSIMIVSQYSENISIKMMKWLLNKIMKWFPTYNNCRMDLSVCVAFCRSNTWGLMVYLVPCLGKMNRGILPTVRLIIFHLTKNFIFHQHKFFIFKNIHDSKSCANVGIKYPRLQMCQCRYNYIV